MILDVLVRSEKASRSYLIGFLYSIASLSLLLKLLSLIHIQIFPLINRVTYFDRVFSGSLSGSHEVDGLIASLMLITILAFYIRNRKKTVIFVVLSTVGILSLYLTGQFVVVFFFAAALWIFIASANASLLIRNKAQLNTGNIASVISGFLLFIAFFELVSLIHWTIVPFAGNQTMQEPFWHFANLNSQLYYFMTLSAPVIMLLLISAVIIRPFIRNLFLRFALAIDTGSKSYLATSRRKYAVAIVILFLVAILLPIYPHSRSLNPDSRMIGTDDIYYHQWIQEMESSSDPLRTAFVDIRGGDRPLTLLIIYFLASSVNTDSEVIIRYLPVLLTPLLVLVSMTLVSFVTRNRLLVIITGFLTITSSQVAVGIYAGFYANWFAIITSLSSVLVVLLYQKHRKPILLPVLLISLIATLMFHVYTWTFTIIVISIFVGISIFKNRSDFRILLPIICLIAGTVVIDVMRSQVLGLTGAITENSEIVGNFTGISEFATRWINLNYLFRAFVGGFFANIIIMILAIFWIIKADLKNPFNRMLFSMSVPVLFPMLVSEYGVQSRILFDVPLFILASVIIVQLFETRKKYYVLVGIAILLFQINYILHSLANLYFQI